MSTDPTSPQAAVDRASALHCDNGTGWCPEEPFQRWPCNTARALNPDLNTPAARAAAPAGLHARKPRNLNRGATAATQEGLMPAALRPAVCPSCRQQRAARLITTVTVTGAPYDVLHCSEKACDLRWLVRANRPRTAPAAA